MRPIEPELRRDLRRLSARVYFLTLRQGARRVLDLSGFGGGTGERLAAAAVLGSLFVLAILAAAVALKLPLGYGLGAAALALAVAWVTGAAFVVGPDDAAVAAEADAKRVAAVDMRAELRQLQAEREAEERDDREREDARRARRAERRPVARCPYCDGVISARAVKCRHCGELLDDGLRAERERVGRRKSFYPLAAFLSWLFPGLGQIVKGQVGRGFAWMLAELVGYLCCFVPGIVVHVLNIFDAAVYSD